MLVTQSIEKDHLSQLIKRQKKYFLTGETLSVNFRLQQLRKLYKSIEYHEQDIYKALFDDFKKSQFEVYGTEISLVQQEIKYFLKTLPSLAKPQKVRSSLASLPASSYIHREPFGRSLIIGPWNYPFMLMLSPLVGSIAAGNCSIMKPSELTKNTSLLIAKIVRDIFPDAYVAVLEGGKDITEELLKEQFDVIFFTGSVRVGQIVYEAASKHLTPCILELGGKSPCIVDKNVDLELAAKRIIWGKFLNGGQTCVAPDYLLVHQNIKSDLVELLSKYTEKFYGKNPKNSPDFPRIINANNFQRLTSYLDEGKIIIGGDTDKDEKYIAPTFIDDVSWSDSIMQEEIFGPILPIVDYDDLDDVIEKINARPKPLALYVFSKSNKIQEKIVNSVSFGGGCINDTLLQFANSDMPFGGVGSSGLGKYHGKESFFAFSNSKGIVKKKNYLDVPLRYAPYKGKLKWVKRILGV